MAVKVLHVSCYTDGAIGPSTHMLGPVEDGGTIVAHTAPGCWGSMITPHLKGSHEVIPPVAVAGARVGDAIALKIVEVNVKSFATSSGTDKPIEGRRFLDGPLVVTKCPGCGVLNPTTVLKGIGSDAIRCSACGAAAITFEMPCGYTMVFDDSGTLGITVGKQKAEEIARNAREYAALPKTSQQNPILTLAKADLPGILARVRPLVGNVGTMPAMDISDSRNAGDLARFLYASPAPTSQPDPRLDLLTDGHMDIDSVRQGAIVVCPVKVDGGGVYVGDVHAMQGDGEIASHTTDVVAETTLQVRVVKGLGLEGPLLLPPVEDLPSLARPFSKKEIARGQELAQRWGVVLEETAPIQVIGSGPDLNGAIAVALARAAKLFDMSLDEVRNRATITGAAEIGRLPGVVTVTMLVPAATLARLGLYDLVREQSGL